MVKNQSFFWYDLETFGLNPAFDRIAQFAGQRTDMDLNKVGDPVILYCRLSPDYFPDPKACILTGITPQEVKKKGIPESEFIEKINNIFSESGTCVCGFNNIQFDDEFIRNALYRNFLDPYEREWKNGNSRWDIMDLVRAAHDLRPDGIKWPNPKENGNPSFKLTDLTEANNIDQTGAHDAMVDVDATIEVARLIKAKQPKLFEHFFKLRNKANVKSLLKLQDLPDPLIYTASQFTNPKGCSTIIVPISPKVDQDNRVLCFDLSKDPAALLCSSSEDVFMSPGLLTVAVNKSPFLAPLNVLGLGDFSRLGINYNSCMAHYRAIMDQRSSLIVKLRDNPVEYKKSDDPDFAIYDGFFTDSDKELFRVIRNTPAEQRLNLSLKFTDKRCDEMLWRHVCRSYPEKLTPEQLKKWKNFASSRLLCPPGNPINDFHFVGRKIDEFLANPKFTEKEKGVLLDLKEYYVSLKRYLGIRTGDEGLFDGQEN